MSKFEKTNEYFIICPNILFDEYTKKIGRDACYLYLYLLRRRGHNQSAFPSYTKIQEDICMSRATVSKCVKLLEDYGLIAKKRTMKSNKYFINDKKMMTLNLSYYQSQDKLSTDFELPDLNAEFILDTTVVHKENSGSSNKALEDRNIEDRNKERETMPDKSGKIDLHKIPEDQLTKEQLIKVKTEKLASWSYNKAKENHRLPVGKTALQRWFFSNNKMAESWIKEYIDDLELIAKIIDHCENDPYWNYNYKSLHNFNTIRTQLQEQHYKEMA